MPRYVDAEEAKKNVFGVLHCEYATPEEDMALSAIDDTTTADVAPVVHAHWRKSGDNYICAGEEGCGFWMTEEQWYNAHFACPACGARMDEKENEK